MGCEPKVELNFSFLPVFIVYFIKNYGMLLAIQSFTVRTIIKIMDSKTLMTSCQAAMKEGRNSLREIVCKVRILLNTHFLPLSCSRCGEIGWRFSKCLKQVENFFFFLKPKEPRIKTPLPTSLALYKAKRLRGASIYS